MSTIINVDKSIKKNNFIGCNMCRIVNAFNLQTCYKCGRYGHHGNKQKSLAMPYMCKKHLDTEFDNKDKLKYINCRYANRIYNVNRKQIIQITTLNCDYL